ncbi:MAG: hypothetical protein NUV63_12160 [Gallionella sp.]|nr:hypothetical protein [Gallionella sp.]
MLNIISLGAGVQSSTMALMAAHGEITPMPDCAIFADTQAEPRKVYEWLDWLEKQLPFPVHRVTAGDLMKTSTEPRVSGKSGKPYMSHMIPAYTVNEDGTKGNYFRQCTDKHKITPLRKCIDELRGDQDASVWIGISTDESHRMKPSNKAKIVNRWPLIENGISRDACLRWMRAASYPTPPRSACIFCPYKRDAEWLRLKTDSPREFQEVVLYEQLLQLTALSVPRMTGVPYLHDSRISLDKVDFRSAEDAGQLSMFGNECEGMCGV